jgi:hypothetical protein
MRLPHSPLAHSFESIDAPRMFTPNDSKYNRARSLNGTPVYVTVGGNTPSARSYPQNGWLPSNTKRVGETDTTSCSKATTAASFDSTPNHQPLQH